MSDKATKQVETYQMFAELLRQAEEISKRFIAAGLPLPPPLSRLRGQDEAEDIGDGGLENVRRPEVARDDWICVPLCELAQQDLVLGMMRMLDAPTRAKAMYTEVAKIQKGVNPGSIYNIFPRLAEKLLERRPNNAWVLSDPSKAPLIEGDYAWGPVGVFLDASVAAYRRMMILNAMKKMPTGLTVIQIVDTLHDCKAPVNKDIIKSDLIVLGGKNQAKKGYQRKWSLVK